MLSRSYVSNHPADIFVCVLGRQVSLGIRILEDSENLIREGLANHFNVFEIEHNLIESFKACQQTPGLRT